jgi:hypothetical protein
MGDIGKKIGDYEVVEIPESTPESEPIVAPVEEPTKEEVPA